MTLANSSDSIDSTQSTNANPTGEHKSDSQNLLENPLSNGIEVLRNEQGSPVKGSGQLPRWTGFRKKTLWDVIQLFLVPVLLLILGSTLSQQAAERQNKLAYDKAKQDTLVKYFDQMAVSLKDGLLEAQPRSEQFIIAQCLTVTALQSLDRNRQHLIFQFLRASRLSNKKDGQRTGLPYHAQMDKANLVYSDLRAPRKIERIRIES